MYYFLFRTAVRRASGTGQRGFTLVEMAVVLAVIGLILGAVALGANLQRSAGYQRVSSNFVQGWSAAYDAFTAGTGSVPGDSQAAPTGRVNGSNDGATSTSPTPLCGLALRNAFLAAGIQLPSGRATGSEDHAVYLDSNGNPQDVQVCFQNVSWAEAGASEGSYVTRNRNVMVLTGLTPALTYLLDSQWDGKVDARFGQLREKSQSNNTSSGTTGVPWSVDERMAYGNTSPTTLDESQVAVVTGQLLMSR